MHIGSTVEGTIAPGKDAVDVIDAVLLRAPSPALPNSGPVKSLRKKNQENGASTAAP